MRTGTAILVFVIFFTLLLMLFGGLVVEYRDQQETIRALRAENQALRLENQKLQNDLEDAYRQIDQQAERVEALEQDNQRLQELVQQAESREVPSANLPVQIMLVLVFLTVGGIGSQVLVRNTTHSHKRTYPAELSDADNTAFIRVTRDEAKAIASWRRRRARVHSN